MGCMVSGDCPLSHQMYKTMTERCLRNSCREVARWCASEAAAQSELDGYQAFSNVLQPDSRIRRQVLHQQFHFSMSLLIFCLPWRSRIAFISHRLLVRPALTTLGRCWSGTSPAMFGCFGRFCANGKQVSFSSFTIKISAKFTSLLKTLRRSITHRTRVSSFFYRDAFFAFLVRQSKSVVK